MRPFYDLGPGYLAIADRPCVEVKVEKMSEFTLNSEGELRKGNEGAGRLREDLLNTELSIDVEKPAEPLPYTSFFDILLERQRQLSSAVPLWQIGVPSTGSPPLFTIRMTAWNFTAASSWDRSLWSKQVRTVDLLNKAAR
uniref:Uncharacterized protein n=1 Tax=Steinernema glaseri TaxID=37863 RepID=A0A1I7Y8C6_9BILA